MSTKDDPRHRVSDQRKRPPQRGGLPRKKYPSDDIDYKRLRRPDARPAIRVPLHLWSEWEELRVLLGDEHTTHSAVIEWLFHEVRDRVEHLRTWQAAPARMLQDELALATDIGASSTFMNPRSSQCSEDHYQDTNLHDSQQSVTSDAQVEEEEELQEHIVEQYSSDAEDEAMYRDEDTTVHYALGAPIHEDVVEEEDVVLDSQSPERPALQPSIVTNSQSIPPSTSDPPVSRRSLPRRPATIAFFERHLIHNFVQRLLPRCHIPACSLTPIVERIGELQQVWSIRISCGQAGHGWTFVTGENESGRNSPLITPMLYHSTLCAGLTFTALAALTSHLGLHVPSATHWHDFQSGRRRPQAGWIDAVKQQWEVNKSEVWEDVKTRLQQQCAPHEDPGLVVFLDCRWDSSRSGYHGTSSIIDSYDNRVLQMTTVSRREERNSWYMEEIGAKRVLDSLTDAGVVIKEVIHDDKSTIDKIIEDMGFINQKDLWHKAKNLVRKFVDKLASATFTLTVDIDTVTSRSDLQAVTNKKLKDWLKDRGIRGYSNLRKEALIHRVADLRGLPEEELVHIATRGLKFPELAEHNLASKFKTWFYVCSRTCKNRSGDSESLAFELGNCADHWAGDHEKCMTLSDRPCQHLGESNALQLDLYYERDGETHKAMKAFMTKYIKPEKMRFYTMARENFMSETFHSVMGKYAIKRIHFPATHDARLCCTAMDWNENIRRHVWKVRDRRAVNTVVRDRPSRSRVLVDRTTSWKEQTSLRIYGVP